MEREDALINSEHQMENALERINRERDITAFDELRYDAFGVWQDVRKEVLKEWDGKCQDCGKRVRHPHVHHVFGRWVRCYRILCPDCHAEIHGNPKIATFGKKGKAHA